MHKLKNKTKAKKENSLSQLSGFSLSQVLSHPLRCSWHWKLLLKQLLGLNDEILNRAQPATCLKITLITNQKQLKHKLKAC